MKKMNKELGTERDVLGRRMVLRVTKLRRTRPPWPERSATTGPGRECLLAEHTACPPEKRPLAELAVAAPEGLQ
ncbi:hypothetical protein AB0903_13500 [Streptomyces sp. NPDC048389]|uniref:hypothetical protein n=1 Tax=Streptomyces sp. NPDC048389 TaxID=3154622 RepID=UPI0034570249